MAEPLAREVTARRRGRPPKISRESVVAAGLAVARSQGLDAVGPRSVARRLDVTPVALYGHISGKEQLLDLVLEQAIHEASIEIVWPESWEDAMVLVATQLRTLLVEQPLLIEAYLRRPVLVPSSVEVADTLIGKMLAAGLTRSDAVDVYLLMLSLCVATAARAAYRRQAAVMEERAPDELVAETSRQMRAGLEHPHVAGAADELAGTDGDERFRSALTLVIEAGRRPVPGR